MYSLIVRNHSRYVDRKLRLQSKKRLVGVPTLMGYDVKSLLIILQLSQLPSIRRRDYYFFSVVVEEITKSSLKVGISRIACSDQCSYCGLT